MPSSKPPRMCFREMASLQAEDPRHGPANTNTPGFVFAVKPRSLSQAPEHILVSYSICQFQLGVGVQPCGTLQARRGKLRQFHFHSFTPSLRAGHKYRPSTGNQVVDIHYDKQIKLSKCRGPDPGPPEPDLGGRGPVRRNKA